MQTWNTKDLVLAGLYEDEQAVVRDAMRALLSERPQLRIELAIHRYRLEEVSLAKAASLAVFPSMASKSLRLFSSSVAPSPA